MDHAARKRVFSAIQPTGNLNIGNYLGALRNWVQVQHDYECIFGIVDMHAITVQQDPARLRQKVTELAMIYMAVGLDPKECHIMVQSQVPAHAELSWMLTCVTPLGWLHRMTQYKAKAEKQEVVGSGLLQYPVLMAADILLYQAAIVPVGEDQKQHVELARDIAQRFNVLYGDTFVMPETNMPSVGARIMGLDDPTRKMSKSDPVEGHAVWLLDPPSKIKKKVMRCTTDSKPAVDFADLGDGVKNLLAIYQGVTNCSNDALRAEFEGKQYGALKKAVADVVVAELEPIQARYAEIEKDPAHVRSVLKAGAEAVEPTANATVHLVKERMGLYV